MIPLGACVYTSVFHTVQHLSVKAFLCEYKRSTREIQCERPSVERYRNMNHKTMPKAMSKNIHCLQKLRMTALAMSVFCLQVSASHTTVPLPLSWATSEAMEISDVVFTIPSTVLRCSDY